MAEKSQILTQKSLAPPSSDSVDEIVKQANDLNIPINAPQHNTSSINTSDTQPPRIHILIDGHNMTIIKHSSSQLSNSRGGSEPSGGSECEPSGGSECEPSGGSECEPSGGSECEPSGGSECEPSGGSECEPSGGSECEPSGGSECEPSGGSECEPSGGSECEPSENHNADAITVHIQQGGKILFHIGHEAQTAANQLLGEFHK